MLPIAEEIKIQTPHLTFAAKRWGKREGMPVLGLHGWLDNAATFDYLSPFLSELQFVALDFVGHGLSEHQPAGVVNHFVDMVDDVFAVAQALQWERFALLGHSMGAALGTLVAGTAPQKITHLLLIEGLGPFSGKPQDSPQVLWKHVQQQQALARKKMTVYPSKERAVLVRMQAGGGLPESCAQPLVDRGVRAVEGGWAWSSDARFTVTSSVYMTEEQVLAFIDHIAAPVLLIKGEASKLPSPTAYQVRCEHIKNLTLKTLPGGHHLHLEHPQLVAEAILSFLEEHP